MNHPSDIPRKMLFFSLFILTAAISGFLSGKVREYRPVSTSEQLAYFPAGKNLRLAGPTFSSILADLTWMQIVQYYGLKNQTDRDFSSMKKLLFTLTDIDPHFTTPYTLGAFILYDNIGDFQGAHELLDKGAVENPDNWRFPFISGFIYWISAPLQSDSMKIFFYGLAKKKFLIAASKPDAPEYVLKFSSASAQKTGEHLFAAEIWLRLYESSDLPNERDIFIRNAKLEIERHIKAKTEELLSEEMVFSPDSLLLSSRHMVLPDGSKLLIDEDGNPYWD
ncbi:hypothetical protein JW890_09280 [candidate division WOR-3 bacterium]|nr:hypothetical protein [candidate division WOR-3 bacterium]